MNVLLDTCACIEILKGNMNVYRIVKSLSNSQRLVSEITVAELMFGVELSKRKFFEQQKVNDFFERFFNSSNFQFNQKICKRKSSIAKNIKRRTTI